MDYMMIFKIRWHHLKAAFIVKNCKKKKKKRRVNPSASL